jgi:co-chaperonin GroES (HSP10)
VVAVGPGTPIGAPADLNDEPWKIDSGEPRYMPVQAEVGDFAIFFRKAAVEITFEGEKYLVVPQAAILALVRNEGVKDDEEPLD